MQFLLVILALVAIFNTGVNAKPPSKIVGGKRVDITEAPYAVMIRQPQFGLICGGTIISNKHIVTAAHCFEGNIATDPQDRRHFKWLRVVAGENSYRKDVKTYEIEKVYSHPNYADDFLDDKNDRADIAVIELKNEIAFSPSQQAVKLASEKPARHSSGLIVGWGFFNATSTAKSRTLQGLMATVIDLHYCSILAPKMAVTKDELCIITSVDSGFCTGDSGGPLIVHGKLAGVISSSIDCVGSRPAVLINVAHHKSWIEDAVNGTAKSILYSATGAANIIRDVENSQPIQKKEEEPWRAMRNELSAWPREFKRNP